MRPPRRVTREELERLRAELLALIDRFFPSLN